jgi:hypothetical protein
MVQTSIFVRKTFAGPSLRDQQSESLLSSQKGPAFFDEDDGCAGFRNFVIACLNYYIKNAPAFLPLIMLIMPSRA